PAEIIQDGVDGLLVPMNDERALAAALLDLIADPATRSRMGEAALASARRFDPAALSLTYDELFTGLAATRRARAWQRGQAVWRGRAGRALRLLRR
ncbi:glycosyltransferase family 4 protein, partial [Streptomyces sp. NPDC127574]